MRYKAAPLSVRNAAPPNKPFHTSRSFRLFLVAVLIPAILIPLVVANASEGITLSPNEALPGTTIDVSGQGFPENVHGQLELDGDPTDMPDFRADHNGLVTVSFTVPDSAPRGGHLITARVTSKRAITAGDIVFSANLTVLAPPSATPAATPKPTPAPTATPDPTTVATATPDPTVAPTRTPAPTATPATPAPTATATATPARRPAPTGTGTTGASIDHVVVIWLENEEATGVTATSMPYLYGLSTTYGRADAYYAVSHPSLPNYLAFWSGSTQGVTDDGTYNFDRASLSSQMAAAGRSWRTYAQDYPGTGCNTGSTYSGGTDGPGASGTYARKHNPAMSFTSVSGTSECDNIQPLADFDPNVNVAFVVPNLCNDAHDCSLATADAFLTRFVPKVLTAPDWAHTLLVVTFDEGSTATNGGGRVFFAAIRPGLNGVVSTTTHTHYSLLRTIENLNGLGCLGAACSANTLSEFTH